MNINEAKTRLVAAIGEDKTKKLENSHVVVVGIGGVGGACVLALTRSFIGHITVIDGDVVEPSNINRQALAFTNTIDMNKCDAYEQIAKTINPDIVVDKKQVFLTSDNIEEVLNSIDSPDFIVDCIDSMTQKVLLAAWAQENNIPLVSAMGAAKRFDPTKLKFADIYDTQECPVARTIRKMARKQGIEHLDVLYTDEKAKPTANNQVLGTMSYLPPVMGEMLAGWTICKLIDIEW